MEEPSIMRDIKGPDTHEGAVVPPPLDQLRLLVREVMASAGGLDPERYTYSERPAATSGESAHRLERVSGGRRGVEIRVGQRFHDDGSVARYFTERGEAILDQWEAIKGPNCTRGKLERWLDGFVTDPPAAPP